MKFLTQTLRIIVITAVVATAGYYSSDHFRMAIDQKIEWMFPCKTTLTYSIGSLDDRFGMSEDEFLEIIKTGENLWENAIGRNLFEESSTRSKIKINLIYDDRQSETQKLKNLGYTIENSKESFDNLKSKYDALKKEFEVNKSSLERDISEFRKKQADFERDVEYWNSRGGAPENEYNDLNDRKENLNREIKTINQKQEALNQSIDTINSLSIVLNDLVNSLNLNVEKYNENQDTLGPEFDQGIYSIDKNGRNINIYQFDNKEKLKRVIAHELGHALGLGHNDDKTSIMYEINISNSLKLSETDISSLKSLCKTF